MATIADVSRRRMRSAALVVLLLFAPLVALAASSSGPDTTQSPSKLYRLSMKDGTSLVGTILGQTTDSLTFRTGSGIMVTLSQKDVGEMEEVNGIIEGGEYRRYDPNVSRLFFGPTAEAVHGGYLSAYEIFFPFLAFGIADVFTLAGGMTIVPGLPMEDQLYYVAPKITLPLGSETFKLAGGALYTNIFSSEGETGAGAVYGVATMGSKGTALTLGMGFGFSGGGWADQPVLLVGGEARLSNSIALISENWFPIGSDVQLLSFGLRFFGDQLSADLGFFLPLSTSESGTIPIPWLGFSYNFGR